MEQKTWVDFRAVKEAVSLQAVLGHYGVNWLRKSGDNLVGRCPIHNGDGERSFSANPSKNAFKCWSCKAHGNVLDFVAAMERCSVHDAALKVKDWFQVPDAASEGPTNPPQQGTGQRTEETKRSSSDAATGPIENKPLGFTLKDIDCTHEYLTKRGVERTTAELFGVGFFPGRGSMQGRIVVPIQNAMGELVAYAGRAIDESEPKYKLPAGFHKSVELFNFHRAVKAEAQGRVIVVEGFFDCIKVHQAGLPGVVALMGCDLSAAQERLLADSFYEIIIMLDGDQPGRSAAAHCAACLASRAWVRIVEVPDNKQPDQLSAVQLQELLSL